MLQIVGMKIRFAFTAAILAPKWAREIRMAGAPQSSKRIGFSECVRPLSITGYGLYYAGGEMLHGWTSWIHLAVGLALPILLLIQIFLGMRTRPSGQFRIRSRFASGGRKWASEVPLFDSQRNV
jgi:hypothetical protein